MSDIGHANWSEVAANNNAAYPHGAAEGGAPSGINDVIRENMGAIKRDWNRGNGVKTTSGTNTITVSYDVAAAAYYTGERFLLKAGGTNTGATTLNINSLGAKTVKTLGGAALVGGEIRSGSYFEVVYDGTDFLLLRPPIAPTVQVFTSSGTWTRPTGCTHVIVEVLGGGGGGGGSASGSGVTGGGGGSGGRATERLSAPGATETVTVGAAGSAGAGTGGNGGAGGTSSFGSGPYLQATGGAGGNGSGANGVPGTGGAGSGGDLNYTGEPGGWGLSAVHGGNGGNSPYGGGARGGINSGGDTGTGYGSGGSGAEENGSNQSGGAGAAGLVIVWEYYG